MALSGDGPRVTFTSSGAGWGAGFRLTSPQGRSAPFWWFPLAIDAALLTGSCSDRCFR
jgi:hypothetical protein